MGLRLYIALILCILTFQLDLSASNIDSLKTVLRTMPLDTNRINLLYEISLEYKALNSDSAITYSGEAVQLSEKLGNKEFISYSLIVRAAVFEYLSKYADALNDINRVEQILSDYNNPHFLSMAYTIKANCYEILLQYDLSLKYHFRALQINEELNRKESIARNLSNIGLIYMNIGNDSLALYYYRKALAIDLSLQRIEGLAAVTGNIGTLFIKQNKFDSALVYLYKSLDYSDSINDYYGLINTKKNICNIYAQTGEFNKALNMINDAYNLSIKTNNVLFTADVLISHAFIYFTMTIDSIISKNTNSRNILSKKSIYQDSSIYYLDKAYEIIKELGLINYKYSIYKLKADIYYSRNQFRQAYESMSKYSIIKDSINKMENDLKIANLSALREVELKQKQIENYEIENKARKTQNIYLTLGLIFVLMTLVAVYIRFKEKKKLSEQLEVQKNLVEYKNNQIYASIRYASTIQHAILPWGATLAGAFKEYFVFFKPKDIVSGDSYWFQEIGGIRYMAVIDCTGHGIPGSMLTVIASSVLDDAVIGKRLNDTGEILTYMNDKVTDILNQRMKENEVNDGMEVALIAINQNYVQFSGAARPLYVANGYFNSYKTDRRGIAGRNIDENYTYSSVKIAKSSIDTLYLVTDGFADQMNETGKKYSTKRFIAYLESITEKSLSEQKELLENELNSYKGNKNQIDDITIIGIKL